MMPKSTGTARAETYHRENLWTLTQNLQQRSGEDFRIRPVYERGHLTFLATWHTALGDDLSASVLLIEDKNLETLNLDRQGPIVNVVTTAGSGAGGTTWEDRLLGETSDSDSISAYGRRELVEVITGVADQDTLDATAAARLAEYKDPRSRVSVVALNRAPADWSRYTVGDTVTVQGFLKHSKWAVDLNLRVYGREWTPDNRCVLELA